MYNIFAFYNKYFLINITALNMVINWNKCLSKTCQQSRFFCYTGSVLSAPIGLPVSASCAGLTDWGCSLLFYLCDFQCCYMWINCYYMCESDWWLQRDLSGVVGMYVWWHCRLLKCYKVLDCFFTVLIANCSLGRAVTYNFMKGKY